MQSERAPVGRKLVPVAATDCDFAVVEVAVEAAVLAGSAKEAAAGVLTLAKAVVVAAAAAAVPVVAVVAAAVAAAVVASTVPAVPVSVPVVVVMVRSRTVGALPEAVLVAVATAVGVPLLGLWCWEGPVWGWYNMTPPDRRLVVAMGRTAKAAAMDTAV